MVEFVYVNGPSQSSVLYSSLSMRTVIQWNSFHVYGDSMKWFHEHGDSMKQFHEYGDSSIWNREYSNIK